MNTVYLTGISGAGTVGGEVCLAGMACGTGVGASGSGATGGTKSPHALPARADSIKPRVDAAAAKVNGKDKLTGERPWAR